MQIEIKLKLELFAKTMPFWPKDYKESSMKVLHSSFVYNTEKNLWKKTSFFEIILTEKVATYGGKDNI